MVESWGNSFSNSLYGIYLLWNDFNLKAILWFLMCMGLYLIMFIFANKPSSVCLALTQGKMKSSEKI
jgi:hypothetical protein